MKQQVTIFGLKLSFFQIGVLTLLALLPFLVSGFEKLVLVPALASFPLENPSIRLFEVLTVCLMLFSYISFTGNTYGFSIDKKWGTAVSLLFIALISISYVFIFSLYQKNFFTPFIIVHLVNWILTVLREEFILRGVIQTEAGKFLEGKLFGIPYAIWFTTIVFSLWHLVNLAFWPVSVVIIQMIGCIPAGIILGVIKEKTGNTLLTFLIHICGDLLFYSVYTLIFSKLFFPLF